MQRWSSTLLLLAAFSLVAAACGSTSSKDNSASTSKQTESATSASPTGNAAASTDALAPPTARELTYEVVESWDIPNGGGGKAIVISPDYLNDTDMTALGEQLKSDTKDDRNAFIFVFDDRQAALLRQAVLNEEASQAELDVYDAHYVGQYTKNGNTGFHEFIIYFDGVMGTNSKTIEY